MNTGGRVAIGPWSVNARLDSACHAGRPYLSLEGGEGHFVAEKWKRWEGPEEEARALAATYGRIAVPRRWIAPAANVQRPTSNAQHPTESAPRARAHRCDRTGEELGA